MRPSLNGIACLALAAALLGGCTTVQVSQAPAAATVSAADAERGAHWRFDDAQRAPADRDGYRPPHQLAVLLPLSGDLATAAAPVRDGLLAAYYGERRARPELRFYDTAGTAGGAVAAYQRALADGADQVLGPLGRDEVDAVFRDGGLAVPVLALNRGTVEPPVNAASFSLAPEDEGAGIADYLASLGARRVLVLNGGDDYAVRSVNAFAQRFASRGGQMQTLAVVGDKPVVPVQAYDVDAVLFAVRGPQARAVTPQLAAAGLAGKPRVAVSLLLSGTGKADEDRVLDGIAFPSERWSALSAAGLPDAAATGKVLPTARGPAARLFAFGFDAWTLSAYLERLALAADGSAEGATGRLRIDPAGNVLRIPAWSTFNNGVIVPMAARPAG